MPSKKVQRVITPRKLTEDEAAEARRLRELVEKDKDEILAEGRRLLAEKRRHQAAAEGATTLGQMIRAAREGADYLRPTWRPVPMWPKPTSPISSRTSASPASRLPPGSLVNLRSRSMS